MEPTDAFAAYGFLLWDAAAVLGAVLLWRFWRWANRNVEPGPRRTWTLPGADLARLALKRRTASR